MMLLSITDKRLLNRLYRVLIYFVGNMALACAYSWAVMLTDAWWVALLGTVLLTIATSYLTLLKGRLLLKPFFLPVFASQLIGMLVVIGTFLLVVKGSPVALLIAITGIASAQLMTSTCAAMKTYVSSLRHTSDHYLYLLSNGASHFEAVMPSVRRALRASILSQLQQMTSPIFVAPPVAFCALLLAGQGALMSALVAVLLSLSVLAVSFFVAVLSLIFVDRSVFDRSGRVML